MMDIIITGQQAWDVEIGSNCKNIALEFSKNHRVLYVNSPLDRRSLLKNLMDPKVQKRLRVVRKKRDGLEKVNENLWVLYPDHISESINWINSDQIFDFFNKWNNKVFASCIQSSADRLGFEDFIHFNDNDIFRGFYLKDYLKPRLSVYYSRDYMLGVNYWKKHGQRLEPMLIAKSDLCVANSPYLTDYCRKYNEKSYYVGQGCDLEMFLDGINANEPEDIRAIKRPRIGYIGAVQSLRLDPSLIHHIAATRPGWNIVLVGMEDDEFRKSPLHQMPNVTFTGPKSIETLPAYLNAFDVCINPQIVNEVTIGNYPRKIDEYLAVGKPTVATRTEGMRIFEGYVYMAENKEDYISLIEQALAEDSVSKSEERRDFASLHSWENSVKEIYTAIEKSL
ncbi:glycosyltransferase [Dyadobacter bucti]|jgi:glycosyltransferase involved in cell wall biosynthesis|uniref:glycosyltransferase n=1 Tax=Dyadobacter bucti TaxID=2572203 RepID=UPI001E42DF9A|nr:glycosyltransferase [Dyadobacter bucti]